MPGGSTNRARPCSIVYPFLCIALIAACGGSGGNSGGTQKPTPESPPAPTVATTSPADNATNVPLNSKVTVTFSKPMSADSLSSMSLKLSPNVSGTVTPSGSTATFTPASSLSPSTKYEVMVPAGVKDTTGQALAADYSFSFTTVDVPTVVSTDPARDALGVSVEAVIKATFSKDMAADSISETSFTLAPQVPGTVSYAAKIATFT